MQQQTRPVGVVILAAIAIAGGIFSLIAGFALFRLNGTVATATTTTLTGSEAGLFGGLGIVSGALELTFGIGAFLKTNWAWSFGIGTYVFNFLYYIVSIIAESSHKGTSTAIIANVASAIISIVIIAYLNTAGIKQYLGRV